MASESPGLFADGFSFLEVPRWREGRLWAADMFAGHLVARLLTCHVSVPAANSPVRDA